jgi:hypothetical protein
MADTAVKRIAVIQGAPSAMVQEMFRGLVDRWRPMLRIAGVIEESHGLPDRKCSAGYLRSIVSGTRFPIFHDLGPGAEACHLEADGAAAAAIAVEKDIAVGCDLVLLSKFGKLEAARGGLSDAFRAAIAAERPMLTSVSPAFEAAWTEFASGLFVTLPADPVRVGAWWKTVRLH